jgi:hypothetical protein
MTVRKSLTLYISFNTLWVTYFFIFFRFIDDAVNKTLRLKAPVALPTAYRYTFFKFFWLFCFKKIRAHGFFLTFWSILSFFLNCSGSCS